MDGELVVQHLWQVKLAQTYVENTRHDHTPLVSHDFTEALHMKIRTALERAVKGLPSLSEDGLNNLLKWHLLQTGAANQQKLLSRKEAILLLLTLLFYDIPPPGVLKLKTSSKCTLKLIFHSYYLSPPPPPLSYSA